MFVSTYTGVRLFYKCSWNADVEIQSVNEKYPDHIQDILFDVDEEDLDATEYGQEGESEDEDCY